MPVLTIDGADVWYQVSGAGVPLVLVQGLGYSLEANWRLVRALAAEHTVIEIDNRGVGRTGYVADAAHPLTIERLAADVAAVLDRLGLGPAHVLGFSMGGLVVGELLVTRPDLLRSVVLACTSLGGAEAVPFTPEVAAHLAHLATLPARQAAQESAAIVYAPNTSRDLIAQDIDLRMTMPTSREGYTAQMAAIVGYRGYADRLATVTTPVLIVHGEDDQLVPPRNAAVMAEAIPDAELAMLPGAGHILTTDARDLLASTILQFTRRHHDQP